MTKLRLKHSWVVQEIERLKTSSDHDAVVRAMCLHSIVNEPDRVVIYNGVEVEVVYESELDVHWRYVRAVLTPQAQRRRGGTWKGSMSPDGPFKTIRVWP